jgi:hypothetical protein
MNFDGIFEALLPLREDQALAILAGAHLGSFTEFRFDEYLSNKCIGRSKIRINL